MNLYKLKAEYLRLLDKDELDAADLTELDHLSDDVEVKFIEIAKAIKNKEAELMAVQAEYKIMMNRANRLNDHIATLRNKLIADMQELKIDSIDSNPMFKLAIQRNPAKVVIEHESCIPDQFFNMKIDRYVDKAGLKKYMQTNEVPGCKLVNDYRIKFS